DLNGHSISGDNTVGHAGIRVLDSNVTVTGGSIGFFELGVLAQTASGTHVKRMAINFTAASGVGVFARGARITNNFVFSTGDIGISLAGDGQGTPPVVSNNVVTHAGSTGIAVAGVRKPVLDRNRAYRNHSGIGLFDAE